MQSSTFRASTVGMPPSLLQPLSALPSSHFSSASAPGPTSSWPRLNPLGLEKHQQHQQSWDMSHPPAYASHPRNTGADDQASGSYRPTVAMGSGGAGAGPSYYGASNGNANPSFGYGSGPAYSASSTSAPVLPQSMGGGHSSFPSEEGYYGVYPGGAPQPSHPVHMSSQGSMSMGTVSYPTAGSEPNTMSGYGWDQGYSSSTPMGPGPYGARPMYPGFGLHGGPSQLLGPFEVKHRRRTTKGQFRVLEDTFQATPKPTAAVRKQLSEQLDMPPRAVQIWFQNRRAKAKAMLKKEASKKTEGGHLPSSSSAGPSSLSTSKLSSASGSTATSRFSSGLASPNQPSGSMGTAYDSATSPSSSLGNDAHRPSPSYGSQSASGLTGFAYQAASSSSSSTTSPAGWAPRSLAGSMPSLAKPLSSSGPSSAFSSNAEESSRFRVPMLPVRDMLGGPDAGGQSSQQQQNHSHSHSHHLSQQPPRGGILLSGLGSSGIGSTVNSAGPSSASAWSAPATQTTFANNQQQQQQHSSNPLPADLPLPFLRSHPGVGGVAGGGYYGAQAGSTSASSTASYDDARNYNRRPGTAGATMTASTSSAWGSSDSASSQSPYLQPLASGQFGQAGQASSGGNSAGVNAGGSAAEGSLGGNGGQERPSNWRY